MKIIIITSFDNKMILIFTFDKGHKLFVFNFSSLKVDLQGQQQGEG